MRRIALVTCRALPEPDPDQEPLLEALREAGLEAELLPWDEAGADPGAFDLCVLRSCWDYHLHLDEFRRWVVDADQRTLLENPSKVVRWNLHKRYLDELEGWGIPVVPTAWFERGDRVDLAALLKKRRWEDVVVKPAVSAASFRTARFGVDDLEQGQAFLEALVAERDAMVQPYLPSVDTDGERALVHVDGLFTHAVRKGARFSGEEEEVSESAVPLEDEELDLAERTIARIGCPLLYARVDLMRDDGGAPRVSELELIEPSLFLAQYPEAMARLVEGVLRRLG